MKLLLVILTLALQASYAPADELSWDFNHGWGKGFVLTISSEAKTITLIDRDEGTTQEKPCMNTQNVIEYISRLLDEIDNENNGIKADDGGVNRIVVKTKDGTSSKVLYNVGPSSAIYLNEGYSPQRALRGAKNLEQNFQAFLVLHTLGGVQNRYFKTKK